MERIFDPHSLVVIGVSTRTGNLAQNILRNLRTFEYSGDLYAVGRNGGTASGVPIAASLDDVPDNLDLAVILTPAGMVADLVGQCGRKGIHRVVVESGGFAEFSEQGQGMQRRLLQVAKRYGIRIVGPNCISVANFQKGVVLPFVPIQKESVRLGPVSVVAQSGGLAMTYIERLSLAGAGINRAVSIGNKADLDEADYLEALLKDPGTRVIVLYLESISKGRRLLDLARSSDKPIIVHKANTGAASQSIARSHTAAMAGDDRVAAGALRQAGILRAGTIRQTIAMAQGMVLGCVRGKQLLIASRSGGHAVIAADAADRWGFSLPSIPTDFGRRLRSLNPADVIAPTNPIDLGTVFDFGLCAQIIEEAARTMRPDALLAVTPYFAEELGGVIRLGKRLESLGREIGIPVAQATQAPEGDVRPLQREMEMPVFTEIDEAVEALAASRDWTAWHTARRPSLTRTVPHETQA